MWELFEEEEIKSMVKRRPAQKKAAHRHKQPQSAVPPSISTGENQHLQASSSKPEPSQTKTETNEDKESSPQYRPGERRLLVFGFIVSVVSFIVLGIYTYFTYQQWQVAERNLRVAEQSAQGYLSLSEIKIDTFAPGKPVALIVIWKNDGNIPVTISESISQVGVVPTLPPANLCEGTKPASMEPIVIPPHNVRGQTVLIRATDLMPDQIQAVVSGQAYFVMCGKVAYQTAGQNFFFPMCSYIKGGMSMFMECGTRWKE